MAKKTVKAEMKVVEKTNDENINRMMYEWLILQKLALKKWETLAPVIMELQNENIRAKYKLEREKINGSTLNKRAIKEKIQELGVLQSRESLSAVHAIEGYRKMSQIVTTSFIVEAELQNVEAATDSLNQWMLDHITIEISEEPEKKI